MFGVLVEWVRDFGLAGDYPCYFAHFPVSRFCAKRLMLLIFHAFWGWFSAGLVSRAPFFVTLVHLRNIYHKTTEESTVNTYLERQSAPLATLPRSGDWWCPLGDNVILGHVTFVTITICFTSSSFRGGASALITILGLGISQCVLHMSDMQLYHPVLFVLVSGTVL